VRTSNVILGQQLRLTFVALTEAEMLSVRSHYNGQQGRFLSFDIPTNLLSGMAAPTSFTPTGYSWIYANTPQVEDIGLQRYTVNIELVTVPPEGANVNGGEYTISTAFVGGAVDNRTFFPTVLITFAPGVGSGGQRDYGLTSEAVTENVDYITVTDPVTTTEDWGTLI
jgi:hypothetical protein